MKQARIYVAVVLWVVSLLVGLSLFRKTTVRTQYTPRITTVIDSVREIQQVPSRCPTWGVIWLKSN